MNAYLEAGRVESNRLTQCARRPSCVTVIRILSEKDMHVAIVSLPLMLDKADFERAGNGVGVTEYCSAIVAILKLGGSGHQTGYGNSSRSNVLGILRRSRKCTMMLAVVAEGSSSWWRHTLSEVMRPAFTAQR